MIVEVSRGAFSVPGQSVPDVFLRISEEKLDGWKHLLPIKKRRQFTVLVIERTIERIILVS